MKYPSNHLDPENYKKSIEKYCVIDNRLNNLDRNQMEKVFKSNSIASSTSKIFKVGDLFKSSLTGFEVLIDSSFSSEKQEHLEQMLCQRCFYDPFEVEYNNYGMNFTNFFNYQSEKVKRRVPQLTKDFLWNQRPTMCNNLPQECPNKEDCSYCHIRDELIYHPLVFKTKFCDELLDSEGVCSKYGRHCAKAHGNSDLRVPFNHKSLISKPKETLDDYVGMTNLDPAIEKRIEEFKREVKFNLSESDQHQLLQQLDDVIKVVRMN